MSLGETPPPPNEALTAWRPKTTTGAERDKLISAPKQAATINAETEIVAVMHTVHRSHTGAFKESEGCMVSTPFPFAKCGHGDIHRIDGLLYL